MKPPFSNGFPIKPWWFSVAPLVIRGIQPSTCPGCSGSACDDEVGDAGDSQCSGFCVFFFRRSLGSQGSSKVVWNICYFFRYIGNTHPNWLSYFWNGMKPPTSFQCKANILGVLLGKFDHDLTWRPKPIDDGECKGNHSQMALIQVSELF